LGVMFSEEMFPGEKVRKMDGSAAAVYSFPKERKRQPKKVELLECNQPITASVESIIDSRD